MIKKTALVCLAGGRDGEVGSLAGAGPSLRRKGQTW